MNYSIKVLLVIAVAAFIASCKKNDDAPQVTATTSVNFVNVSNNTINFYQNGTRITNASSFFPGGTLGYFDVTAGLQNYQVKLAGNSVPLFTKPLTFDTARSYTLYVAGSTAGDAFFTADTLVADTAADHATIRFVNASPNAGNMVVAFTNKGVIDEIKFNKVPYKTTTKFISVKSGTFNLAIYREAFPGSPLLDTVTLDANRVYTLYGYGTTAATSNQGLSNGLIINR